MKDRNNTVNLDEKGFDMIKALLKSGVKHKLVMEITNRSTYTIAMVEQVADWEGYKKLRAERHAHRQENKRLHSPAVEINTEGAPQPRPPMEVEIGLQTPYVLARIAVALERLADAWEAQPKQRKFF